MDRLVVDAEKRLVAQCLAGDRRAWEEFFTCHIRTISAVVSRPQWGFPIHDREDVAQEVIRNLILSLKEFQFRSKLSTFVYAIAVNTCVGEVRKRHTAKRRGELDCVALDPLAGVRPDQAYETALCDSKTQEELLLELEDANMLRNALGGLDQRCRRLLRLRYYDDLSFKEIAKEVRSRENTLVVQVKRCLVRVLSLIRAEAQDDLVQR
jgi:RNA polymerase sigma factor (sigma-70 family)